MSCHICGQEAVDRCYTCGKLFCAQHGDVDCVRCSTAIAAGDKRIDHISTTRLRGESGVGRKPWWRTQEAEDYEPPSCHICRGLARRICKNCERHYCSEHAGPAYLCRDCGRSSLMGIWCLLGGLTIMGCILLWGFLAGSLALNSDDTTLLGLLIFGTAASLAAMLITCISCMTLFRRAGRSGWIAFVPVWNLVVLLELAGKPGWWVLLYILSPLLLGLPIIPLQILLGLGLAQNFGRSREFGVGLGLLPVVFLPILACDDGAYAPR